MIASVKFDKQASVAVLHIGPTEKTAITRPEIDLDFRAGKASLE